MAEWKKVVVSGSAAELASLKVDDLTNGNVVIGGGSAGNLSTTAINGTGNILATTGATGVIMTGSFTGSFTGDGSGLSGVAASFPTTQKDPLVGTTQVFVNDGASKYATVSQFNSSSWTGLSNDITATNTGVVTIANNAVTFAKIQDAAANTVIVRDANSSGDVSAKAVTNTQILIGNGNGFTAAALSGDVTMTNTGAVTIANNAVETAMLATSLGTLGTNNFTGSFTGSFTGDGSGLTGLATTLTVQGDTGGTTSVNLQSDTLDIAGGTNISTVTSTDTITINLDSTITGDITFANNIVVQGTASFQNTTNLEVADKFILLNSGSSTDNSPGGIVIQQNVQDEGVLFGYDAAASANLGRWGVTSSFDASSNTFTADAYIAMVIDEDASQTDIALYQQRGNLKIDTSDDIWIYV